MNKKLKLIGYPFSPYVRKVIFALEYKGLEYKHDPIVPFIEREKVLQYNKQGSVPILLIDGEPLTESSEICKWLDEYTGNNFLFPEDEMELTKVQEIEQWADSTLMSVFGGSMFFQKIVLPFYIGQDGNEKAFEMSKNNYAPQVLQELESLLREGEFITKELSIADIAVSSWIRAGMLSGFEIDNTKYPKVVNYLKKVYSIPAYKKLIEKENSHDIIIKAKNEYLKDKRIIE